MHLKPAYNNLIFIFMLFLSTASLAQEQSTEAIGTIAEIEGTAAIARAEEDPFLAKVGQEITMGEVIETGPGSKALILFIDDTELVLGENARLLVDEYVYDASKPAADKGKFTILRGAFVFVSGLIAKKEKPDVVIETGYGSIGIRGTTVWGGAIDDEYNVFVQEGEVTFSTNRGRVTIAQGQGTKVYSRNAIPARAVKWQQEKITRAQNTVSLKNVERVKERVAEVKQKNKARREQRLQKIRGGTNQIKENMKNLNEEKRNLRKEKIENKKEVIEKQKTIRQERMQNKGEKRSEIKTRQENIRSNVKQRKQERIGPDSAHEFERREKTHLQENKPQRQQVIKNKANKVRSQSVTKRPAVRR